MRKIKVMIASMFGAIALVFACVFGTKINAETYDDFEVSFNGSGQTYKIGDNAQVVKNTYDDNTTSITSNFKVAGTFCNGKVSNAASSSNMKCESNGLKFQKNDCDISFVVGIDANDIAITLYIGADSTANNRKFEIYRGTDLLDSLYNSTTANTTKTFNYTAAGTYHIKYAGSAAIHVKSISVDYPDGEKTNAEKVDEAITAIQAIGTVSYSTTSKGLIATATTKVNACANGIDDIAAYDTENSTSYATTYNTAVSTYNGLVDTAVNNFTSSVTAIGTVNSESKSLIDAAFTAYAALLSSEQELTSVSTAKTSLDAKHKEFVTTFGEVKRDLLTSEVVDILKTNKSFTEETKLYTQTMSSIFSATKGVQMDKGNSKTYDNVTYSDRFKTGGVMVATDGVVSCALKVEAPCAGKVSLIGVCGTSETTRNIKVCRLVNGELEEVHDYGNIVAPSTANLYEVEIPEAGTYYIGSDTVKESGKSAGTINFFKMTFTAKASVFAEMNDTTGTLRFVGTLTGITDLDDIASIELVLKKDGVATNSKIYLTTCYTSVTGTTQTCAAANGTYYVIFRLNNANSLATGTKISKQLIITLKDNSTVTSEVTEITM